MALRNLSALLTPATVQYVNPYFAELFSVLHMVAATSTDMGVHVADFAADLIDKVGAVSAQAVSGAMSLSSTSGKGDVEQAAAALRIFTKACACSESVALHHGPSNASAAIEAISHHSDSSLALECIAAVRALAGLGEGLAGEEHAKWEGMMEACVGSAAVALSGAMWLEKPTPHLASMLATALSCMPDGHPGLAAAYACAGPALAATAGALPPFDPARAYVFAAARTVGQAATQLPGGSERRACCAGVVRSVGPAAVACLCEGEDTPDPKLDPKAEAFKLILVAYNIAEEAQKEPILELFVPILAKLTAANTAPHLTQLAAATITSMATAPAFKAQLVLLPDAMKLDVGKALKNNAAGAAKQGGIKKAAPKKMKKLDFASFK